MKLYRFLNHKLTQINIDVERLQDTLHTVAHNSRIE